MSLRVLYVGGMGRSGSTLTDLMLDRLPGHLAVGELFYLWRNGLQHDGLCACGQPFSRCEFWSAVGDSSFGGWANISPARVRRLQAEVDTTSRVPLLLSPRRPAAFASALAEYGELLTALYRGILDVSGAQVVVDSSKRPSLAYVLRGLPDIDLTVAHVLRDPRGVAYSFNKHVPLPTGAALAAEMPRSGALTVGRRWNTVNGLISMLGRLGVPTVRIRYEDLIVAPERELRRVAAAENLAEALDFSFLTGGGMTVPSTHVVAGGRIRLVDGVLPIHLDEAWRREMPARERRLVTATTTPARIAYGYAGGQRAGQSDE